MELMGFRTCLEFLVGYGILITAFVSDQHVSIASYMKKSVLNIKHHFDIWHLKKRSKAYKKLCSALNNVHLVKGIKHASPFAQTSCLEGFHSVLNHFAPKMIAFSYAGMYCRGIQGDVSLTMLNN